MTTDWSGDAVFDEVHAKAFPGADAHARAPCRYGIEDRAI